MSRMYNVDVSADTTLVTVAETVVATLTGVSVKGPGATIRLHGNYTITTGTSTTAVTGRIRRDGVAGTIVGEGLVESVETAAGGTEDHDVVQTDFPGEIAGASYVLTVQQTGAAANGTVLHASLEAQVDP